MRVVAIVTSVVTTFAAASLALLTPSFAISPGPCQPQYEQVCQSLNNGGCQVFACQGVGHPIPPPKEDQFGKTYASGYKCIVASTLAPNSFCSNTASGVVRGICCLGQCLASETMTCPNAEPGLTCVVREGSCQPTVTTCNPQKQDCASLWQTQCGSPKTVMASPAPVCSAK
jgi:hypothetical protein